MGTKTEERSVVAIVESFNAVVVVNKPAELLEVLARPHGLHRQLALTYWKDGDRKVTVIPATQNAGACVVELVTFQAERMIAKAKSTIDRSRVS